MFVYAQRHKAITSNPVDGIDFSGNGAKRRNSRHYPLTAEQVAAVADSIGDRYPVYQLLTLFAAYTGLRAEELAGLEVADVRFTPGPAGVRASVNVDRAKKRRGGEWVSDTLKSVKSRCTVPLPGWLAERMRNYLDSTHPRATEPHAPLWPNRALGGALGAGAERSRRFTCFGPPWRLSGYRRAARPRKMHPLCAGSACMTYAIRSRRCSFRRGCTLCRCRSGWATALSR